MPVPSNKLVIGTAQFGQDYGITNNSGQVPTKEVESILKKARKNNITSIDTASAYGTSECVLGKIGVSDLNIITKLPSVDIRTSGFTEFYEKSIKSSLQNLQISSVNTILLHRPEELLGVYGNSIYKALSNLKTKGYTKKIGVSIYSPKILSSIVEIYELDSVQVPINVFDRRIITSGWLEKLTNLNISVIARSIFLQGILLSKIKDLHPYFHSWNSIFKSWNTFCKDNGLSPLEASLQFVAQIPEIDKIIIGIESEQQFSEILNSFNTTNIIDSSHLIVDDINLISPIHWQT